MKIPSSHSRRKVKLPVRGGNVRTPIEPAKDRDRVPRKPKRNGR